MRKLLLHVSLLLAVTCLSCVPTPSEESVVQKDQQQMLNQARSEIENKEADSFYERLDAPFHIENKLTDPSGRLTVIVDADLSLPEDELPIARVIPVDFTLEQILAFAGELMPKDAKYVDFDAGRSKGYYNSLIQNLQWAIDHWDQGGQDMHVDYSVEDAKKSLSELLMQQSNAPESLPEIDPQTIPCNGEYPINGTCRLIATKDNETFSMIHVNNFSKEYGTASLEYVRDQYYNYFVSDGRTHQDAPPSTEIKETVFQLIDKLPIDGFDCSAVFPAVYFGSRNDKIPCYHFVFTRSINRVSETATDVEVVVETYDKPWGYEMIHVIADENGIAAFKYANPYSVTEIVAEQTKLLPFSEILRIFNKRITVYHNDLFDGTRDALQKEYHITNIRLGLVSIKEENADSGLLVPAWDFLGYERYWESDESDRDAYPNELHSFLTINAIDGSIISRGDI